MSFTTGYRHSAKTRKRMSLSKIGNKNAQSKLSPINRIKTRIAKRKNGCWEWTGGTGKKELYGRVWLNGNTITAHSAVYQLLVGEVPKGKELDHLCRNRLCVNPKHLEAVTHAENLRRRVDIKLDFNKVQEIRTMIKAGYKQKIIAEKYGIYPSVVSRIGNGKAWVQS